jgi:5-methylcytosine-specific restriction endonuclease McrA
MAGDWIPWQKGLAKKREILAISQAVGRDRRWVAATLMEFWEWFDSESESGIITDLKASSLPEIVTGTDGRFWNAVIATGWLSVESGSLLVPHFDRWLGHSAKKRLEDALRKKRERKISQGSGAKISAEVRRYVLKRDNGTCAYCGWNDPNLSIPLAVGKRCRVLSIDHVIPVRGGGQTDPGNLVTACFRCNASKNGRTPEDAGMTLDYLSDAAKLEVRFFLDRNGNALLSCSLDTHPPPSERIRGDVGGKGEPPPASAPGSVQFSWHVWHLLDSDGVSCPGWFPGWAERHAIRFAWRREDDPKLVALWWQRFSEVQVTREEADAASNWLQANAERLKLRGRPQHLEALMNRIITLRKLKLHRPNLQLVEEAKAPPGKWAELRKKQHRSQTHGSTDPESECPKD